MRPLRYLRLQAETSFQSDRSSEVQCESDECAGGASPDARAVVAEPECCLRSGGLPGNGLGNGWNGLDWIGGICASQGLGEVEMQLRDSGTILCRSQTIAPSCCLLPSMRACKLNCSLTSVSLSLVSLRIHF